MEHLKDFQIKTDSLISLLKEEFSVLRANRPTPKLIENLYVSYAGEDLRIKQLGSITIEPPRDLILILWDKSMIALAVKAIESANLGVGVSAETNAVRVKLPELTNERKEELIKIIKSAAEESRIKMRIERDDVNKKINEEPDKDRKFKLKEELQKKVDTFNETVSGLVDAKIKEISF